MVKNVQLAVSLLVIFLLVVNSFYGQNSDSLTLSVKFKLTGDLIANGVGDNKITLYGTYNGLSGSTLITGVDSGSSDNTIPIAEPYIDRLITTKQRGKLTARNLATLQSYGNIIVSVDSDIYINSSKFYYDK